MSCFQMVYPSYAVSSPASAAYLPYYHDHYHDYRAPFSADQYRNWSPKRESGTTSFFDTEPAGTCRRMTLSRDVTDKYVDVMQSRRHDVTELQVTSARRCADSVEQAPVDTERHHHHHQQQQQPTSTQYISDTCVLMTYFSGDVETNVDQHFARALSRPSSFGPDCHGTTPPSVHTGIPTHSASWFDGLQTEANRRTHDSLSALTTNTTSVVSDDAIQSVAAADAVTSLTSPWSTAFITTPPLTRDLASLQSDSCLSVNTAQMSQYQPHHQLHRHRYHHHHHQQQQQQQCDERDAFSLAASFAAVVSASHLPYSTLLHQRHLQLQQRHHHQLDQQLVMTSVMTQTPASLDSLQWSRDNMATSNATSCFSMHGRQ